MSAPRPERHVVLLGLMGAGKTSLGRRVAERLGRPLLDGDEVLEQRTGGRTAADIVAAAGADHLHRLEAEIALECLASTTPAVIAPAASVIEVDAVRDAMAGLTVVWLTAPPEHLAARAQRKHHRPFVHDADPVALFAEQLSIREPLVLPFADLVIDVSQVPKEAQANAVASLLEPGAGPQPG